MYAGWQPATGAWLWRQLARLGPLPGSVLIFQCVTYFTSIAMVARRAQTPAWRFALVALLPVPFLLLGSVWKDAQMGAALTASLAFPLATPLWWAAALCFRSDAVIALAPLAWHAKRRKLWLSMLILLVVAVAALNAALVQRRLSLVSQQIFLQDLATVSVATNANQFPDFFCKRPLECSEALRRKYNEEDIVPILFDHQDFRIAESPSEYAALVASWLRSVPMHPWLIAHAHALRWAKLFGIEGSPASTVIYWSAAPPVAADHALSFYEWMFRHSGNVIFRGWPYLLVLLVMWRKKVAQSGLIYALALFFIAPAVEFRYLAWPVFAAVIALL